MDGSREQTTGQDGVHKWSYAPVDGAKSTIQYTRHLLAPGYTRATFELTLGGKDWRDATIALELGGDRVELGLNRFEVRQLLMEALQTLDGSLAPR